MNWLRKIGKNHPGVPGEVDNVPAFEMEEPHPEPPPFEEQETALVLNGSQLELPKQLGRYRLVSILDHWGTDVYLAEFEGLRGQRFAVQVLPSLDPDDSIPRKRFEREIAIYRDLNHPNVCRMFEWGVDDDLPFLVMELMEGEILREFMNRYGPMTLDQARPLIVQLLKGVDGIHARDIVHRNLRPESIFLTADGQLKIMNFNMARKHGMQSVTTTGTTLGTPGFISPEQLRNPKNVDGRSDLFNVGLVTFELLVGAPAISAHSLDDFLHIMQHWEPLPFPPRSDLIPEVQDWLNRLLAPNRDERFGSARAALQSMTF